VETWAQFITQLGLSVTLVMFFVWTGNEREKANQLRVSNLEDFIRTSLLTSNAESTRALVQAASALADAASAIADSSKVIGSNTVALKDLEKVIQAGMCPISKGETDEARRRHQAIIGKDVSQ
jgi:hypothetical protein